MSCDINIDLKVNIHESYQQRVSVQQKQELLIDLKRTREKILITSPSLITLVAHISDLRVVWDAYSCIGGAWKNYI